MATDGASKLMGTGAVWSIGELCATSAGRKDEDWRSVNSGRVSAIGPSKTHLAREKKLRVGSEGRRRIARSSLGNRQHPSSLPRNYRVACYPAVPRNPRHRPSPRLCPSNLFSINRTGMRAWWHADCAAIT